MSEWFWKKLNYLAGLGAIATLFVLIVFAAQIEIKDLDLWLHIGTGRYIVEHQEIPRVDVLSCTMSGQPWINHEWLFQIIVYLLSDRWGVQGLVQLQTGIVVITFLLLLCLGYQGEKQLGRVFLLLLVFLIYQTRFTVRPDIFSLLFLTLYIYCLTFLLNRWGLIVVFFIQVLWTNMHGFFILGPLIVGISLFTEFLKRQAWASSRFKKNPLPLPEYQRLQQMFVVALLVCLINPYFIKGALYPTGVLFSLSGDSKIFFQYITELRRPIGIGNVLDIGIYPEYKFLIVISLLSFFYTFRKLNLGLLLFWLVFLWMSLVAVRNIVFFAIASYIVIIFNTQDISFKRMLPPRLRKASLSFILRIGLNILLVLWMVNYLGQLSLRGYFDFDRFERKSEYDADLSLRSFPHKAVDFLLENNIRGHFLNDFNSGAYLVGRASPNIKVFIDGRTEAYGAEFFAYYRKLWQGDEQLIKKAINDYQLTGAFLHSVYSPVPAQILRSFYENKEWALVYFDYDATVFLKEIPSNQEIIKKYRIDLSGWQVPEVDLLKFGVKNLTPYPYINRAHVLFNLKFYNQAKAEIQQALKIIPAYPEAYQLLGRVLLEQRQYHDAFEYLRKAKILDPYDMETRYYLAQVFYELNVLNEAENQCQRILSENPKNEKAKALLSLIHNKKKESLP